MAQIGIFRMGDATKAAGDQLRMWQEQGLFDPKNPNEFAAALNRSARQMEDLGDQAKVAGAALPQLQQALNDAGNARKQLDSLMVEGMSVNRGFFTSFGQQIRGGASAWDAFKSSGLDALGKISDKLVSMAADKLWASAFGGSSSGIGSLFGIGGGAGSGSVPTWSGSELGAGTGGLSFPMFANGGFTGSGGKFEPAGIVHKGEYVMDAVTVRRVGVANLDSLRGYADGGLVGHMSRAAGNSSPAVVMQDNRQISIGEGASQETVLQLREELARDRAARHADTVRIFHMAKKRREI
ncbi:phage tail tape measure protein [Bradyrhizobium ottawaense]|uniref:Phage tail tape measure protein n=1 Tax=Bradyrhizobium ottawaense TaxID=931866 RepID=A0A2U8PE24_9BRAD|nr:phage tail tape measure protein [Bradyrhizobium ottawaense]AWL95754.1 phage tail tape measure protein [Bradyrhizobium ottawaense]